MRSRLSDDLTMLTTKLMMCGSKREIISLSGEFGKLIEKVIEQENNAPHTLTAQEKTVTATIKFTKQEVANMAKSFKKEFIANGLVARIIKRQSGKRTFLYEIRYRRNGYNISASSTDITEAKQKFLEMTEPDKIEKYRIRTSTEKSDIFADVFEDFYRYKSTTKVTPKTLKGYRLRFNAVPQSIKEKSVIQINTAQISEYMNTLSARDYEETRTMFNAVFKYAMACNIIIHNPVSFVQFQRADRQIREALTELEIKSFLSRIIEPKFDKIRQSAYFYYFFGLRASELDEETRREGDFLITRNRKRKNGKIEYKKIPIPKEAESLIDWSPPLYKPIRANTAGKLFHELLGEDKTAYNLRHTFSTICQESVRQEIVEIWLGDSPVRLIGKHYTHFSDKFMRSEMDKVTFPILTNL